MISTHFNYNIIDSHYYIIYLQGEKHKGINIINHSLVNFLQRTNHIPKPYDYPYRLKGHQHFLGLASSVRVEASVAPK